MIACCTAIARALDSSKPEFDAEKAWLSLGAGRAEDLAYHLETCWRLKRDGMKAHPAADMLIRLCNTQGKIGPGPVPADVMIELPWMLKTVMEYLLKDGDYENAPEAGPAIAARMLACMLSSLEKVEGLNWEPDAA